MKGHESAFCFLSMVNKISFIFGLGLPLHVTNNSRRYEDDYKKFISFVFLIFACLDVFILTKRYQEFEQNTLSEIFWDQILLIVPSVAYGLVLVLRYMTTKKQIQMIKLILTVQPHFIKKCWKQKLVDLLKTNFFLIIQFLLYICIFLTNVSLKIHKHGRNVLVYIFEDILQFIHSIELILVSSAFSYLIYLIKLSETVLCERYSMFYRVPPAELSKTDNGDFLLVGWMTDAIHFRNWGEDILMFGELRWQIFSLSETFDLFNRIFGPMVLICIVNIVVLYIDLNLKKGDVLENISGILFPYIFMLVSLVHCKILNFLNENQ